MWLRKREREKRSKWNRREGNCDGTKASPNKGIAMEARTGTAEKREGVTRKWRGGGGGGTQNRERSGGKMMRSELWRLSS